MAPAADLVNKFRQRADNQIMGLELLAISLGMCTFEFWIKGRSVVIHCDNTGSEASVRRGSARSWDHAQLVHQQWLHAAVQNLHLHIKRVATKDNIADLPSRQEYKILREYGAIEVEPKLAAAHTAHDAWDELTERWRMHDA